jgi:DNA-binding transcriptional MerR regulator
VPDKAYFKIGEVAELVGVKAHVLRYWEAEFGRDIRPQRSAANQRVYRRQDVLTFLEIKRLRYEEGLEVPGARRRLAAPRSAEKRSDPGALRETVRAGLEELIRIVDEDERGE